MKKIVLIGPVYPFLMGLGIGIRFLIYMFAGEGVGHIQSLVLASTLLILGFMTWLIGIQADIIAANRKILEDIQYHVRKADYRQREE